MLYTQKASADERLGPADSFVDGPIVDQNHVAARCDEINETPLNMNGFIANAYDGEYADHKDI